MSDGHLLKDGRIGGTKLEDRRRDLEQRHLVSPRTTTHEEQQLSNREDADKDDNEDHADIFRDHVARGQNIGNEDDTDGNEDEDDDDDDDDDDDGSRHASISDYKLRNLLERLKAINRKNRLLDEQRIARRGFLGWNRLSRRGDPWYGGA